MRKGNTNGLEGYRLSYVTRKDGVVKTITGYWDEDLYWLIEDARTDKGFVAVVREAVFRGDTGSRVVPVGTLHGMIPESFTLGELGYSEIPMAIPVEAGESIPMAIPVGTDGELDGDEPWVIKMV